MDALIVIALALLVVIAAFYFLGVGKPKQAQQHRPAKGGGAYSKRSRRKR